MELLLFGNSLHKSPIHSKMPAQRTKRTTEQNFTIIKPYEEVSTQKGAKAPIISWFQLPKISSLNTILTKTEETSNAFQSSMPSNRTKLRQVDHPQLHKELRSKRHLQMGWIRIVFSANGKCMRHLWQKKKQKTEMLEVLRITLVRMFNDGWKATSYCYWSIQKPKGFSPHKITASVL